jgi:transposase
MSRERLSMRKLSEVLRLRLEQDLSVRQISHSCNLARSTVADYLARARVAGLGWPLAEGMDEEKLEKLLFPIARDRSVKNRPELDMIYIRNEMRRKHVTLQLLWEEYRGHTAEGYSYSQYCQLYRNWLGKQAVSMRQEHRAGEKLFIDYAGDTIPIYDQLSGEIRHAHLFVAVLGCSNYTYAEAMLNEQLAEWIEGQVHAFEFFGGVPDVVVPDNPKALVTSPCWYDPDINLTYQELAEHYGFAVLPARARKPRDKAKVESGVLVAERWILAALRHQKFFSLGELNDAIKVFLKRLNEHPFKKLPGNRKDVFEKMECAALKPLPAQRYEMAWWKRVSVNIDYHVDVDGHYYSVPYGLIRQQIMARYTRTSVELFHKSRRVAVHARSHQKGHHTTIMEHRPPAHQKFLDWTPERLTSWAGTIGPNCEAAAKYLLSSRKIPEHAYRPCLGLIRLSRRYGNARVDRACYRAIRLNIVGYRHIESILKTGRDQMPLAEESKDTPVVVHNNLRGAQYYQ